MKTCSLCKEYPKYNRIKLSLREFKDYPMSKSMEFLTAELKSRLYAYFS